MNSRRLIISVAKSPSLSGDEVNVLTDLELMHGPAPASLAKAGASAWGRMTLADERRLMARDHPPKRPFLSRSIAVFISSSPRLKSGCSRPFGP
jgi:hypothetical protein